MGRRVICLIFVQVLIIQVFTANLHPALKQYLLSGLVSAQSTRSVPITIKQQPNLSSLATLANLFSSGGSVPKTQSINPSALLAALTESYQPVPSISSNALSGFSSESLYPNLSQSNQADSSLLNNLAIAMQLLIMSNLLGSPPQESVPESVSVPGYPLYEKTEPVTPVSVSYLQQNSQPAVAKPQAISQNQAYYPTQYEPQQPAYAPQQTPAMHNANFVGASTFADANPLMGSAPPMGGPSPNRSGFTLMSPYEALSPSSPFSDPIISSPYGSVMTSKRDFQSPYTAMMAADNKDVFSMSDFF